MDIYATKKKITDTSNLPEFLPDDDVDEEATTSDQEDDNLPAGPVVPSTSSAAGTQSQNFFTNPLPRHMEHAGFHPQYEETADAATYTPLLHNIELRRAHRASIDAHNEAQNAMYVDPTLPSLSTSSTQPYFRLVPALRRVNSIIPLPPMLLAFAALKLAYADGHNFAVEKLLQHLTLVLPEHADNCVVVYIAGDTIKLAAEDTKDNRTYQLTEYHILHVRGGNYTRIEGVPKLNTPLLKITSPFLLGAKASYFTSTPQAQAAVKWLANAGVRPIPVDSTKAEVAELAFGDRLRELGWTPYPPHRMSRYCDTSQPYDECT